MRKLTLREIQQESLKVLLELDKICKEKSLTYFVGWGTLIGAVRHHGFIPWDDDLDVLMPRKDYTKLKNYFSNEYKGHLKLCSRDNTRNYTYGIPRLVNQNFNFITQIPKEKQFDLGAFVDIYPIDSCGNDSLTAKRIFDAVTRKNGYYSYTVNPGFASAKWKIPFKYIMRIWINLVKGKNYANYIDNEISEYIEKHTSPNDRYVGIVTWKDPYGKYLWERDWFSGTVYLDFEGYKVPAPKGYDELLTYIYGDYMKLPPEEKRVPHHNYILYVEDK